MVSAGSDFPILPQCLHVPFEIWGEKKDFDAYYIYKGVNRENLLMARIHVLHKKILSRQFCSNPLNSSWFIVIKKFIFKGGVFKGLSSNAVVF